MHELLSAVSEETLVDWARVLVQTPSPQTERFEAEPAVQSFVADTVRPILVRRGLPARIDSMGNLIAEIGPRDGTRSLMLLTYAMTHPASSMRHPFAGELLGTASERTLRGRGIAEQKGALAAAIAAFIAASRQPLHTRLVLALSTAGETGQHKAAESILEALGYVPDLTIVAIGTGGRVSLANKGRVDVHIEIQGKASHSSSPWLGVDAIKGARAVIDRLDALDLGNEEHPLLGRATLTPTAIRSFPQATHTLQNLVQMTYDRRLLPGQDPDLAVIAIQRALADMPPWSVSVRAGAIQYPAELPTDSAFLCAARAGSLRMGLPAPDTFVSHGCVDAGLFVRRGAEAAMWGPGDQAMWHTDEESLPIRALVEGAAAYLGFILELQDAGIRGR